MAAKAKNVDFTKTFIKAFSGVLRTSQASKMELFIEVVNGIILLPIFTRSFISASCLNGF